MESKLYPPIHLSTVLKEFYFYILGGEREGAWGARARGARKENGGKLDRMDS